MHGRLFSGKDGEAAGEGIKVLCLDVFGHVASEDSAHGNDGGGVGAEQDGADACLVAVVDDGIQGQRHPVMQLGYRLTRPGRGDSWVVVEVEGGKEGLQGLGWSRGRVLEGGGAVPF